jgi:hypothetical protein
MMIIKRIGLLLLLVIASGAAWAHVVVSELEKMSRADTVILYMKLGFLHILPSGLDHILFVLSLFLLDPRLKSILKQSIAFTVAHSATLALAMYGVVKVPAAIIEPLITLSIMFVAAENIFSRKVKSGRIGLVFLFGLVHGLGFASSLSQVGLPPNDYFVALLMFNLGVELGQVAVIFLAFFAIGKWFGAKPFYRKSILVPASLMIVIIAGIWTIERVLA